MNKTTLNSQKEKHSLLSLRRATFRRQRARRGPQHFYPRSPCGERRCQTLSDCRYTAISIHALLAESDARFKRERKGMIAFLSTLSLRRATWLVSYSAPSLLYFYPRSPCGERRAVVHTPHWYGKFLSTLSLRRATSLVLLERLVIWYFYPRSPCGERPLYLDTVSALASFLSTLSLRRATSSSGPFQGDQLLFYPRSPCGERRKPRALKSRRMVFSIHALLAESDID